jgi:hypothetical protein
MGRDPALALVENSTAIRMASETTTMMTGSHPMAITSVSSSPRRCFTLSIGEGGFGSSGGFCLLFTAGLCFICFTGTAVLVVARISDVQRICETVLRVLSVGDTVFPLAIIIQLADTRPNRLKVIGPRFIQGGSGMPMPPFLLPR